MMSDGNDMSIMCEKIDRNCSHKSGQICEEKIIQKFNRFWSSHRGHLDILPIIRGVHKTG